MFEYLFLSSFHRTASYIWTAIKQFPKQFYYPLSFVDELFFVA